MSCICYLPLNKYVNILCVFLLFVQLKADVEEHLDVTIDLVEPDFKIPVNEFDGKVTYGQKKRNTGTFFCHIWLRSWPGMDITHRYSETSHSLAWW